MKSELTCKLPLRYMAGAVVMFGLGSEGLMPAASAQIAPNTAKVDDVFSAGETGISAADTFRVPQMTSSLTCASSPGLIDNLKNKSAFGPDNFKVRSFIVSGQDGAVLDPGKFKALYQSLEGFEGADLDLEGLQALAVRTQCILRETGNLLSAVQVPPQRFEKSGADIRLRVVLGYISQIDYTYKGRPIGQGDNSELSDREARLIARIINRFSPLLEGGESTDVDLERAIILASKIPGVKIKPAVRQSEDGREGSVAMTISVLELDAMSGNVAVLNKSPESFGRWGALSQISVNSQFIAGDKIESSAYLSEDFDAQQVLRGSYSVPLAGGDTALKLYGSVGKSAPGEDLAALDIESRSLIYGAELSYPVHVRAAHQADIYAGLEIVDQDTNILSADFSNDKLSILFGGVRGQAVTDRLTSAYDVQIRKGQSAFGASKSGDLDVSRIGANPQALVFKLNAQAQIKPVPGFKIISRINGQYSDDALLANEEYAVGNFTIGRGYEPGQLSGDTALAAAFDFVLGPYSPGDAAGFTLQPYAFIDAAKVSNEDPLAEKSRHVTSQGLGVIVDLTDNLSADIIWANADKKVSALSPKAPGNTVLVQTSWRF